MPEMSPTINQISDGLSALSGAGPRALGQHRQHDHGHHGEFQGGVYVLPGDALCKRMHLRLE
jgi:hypothetical protein